MDVEIQVALNFLISFLYNKLPRRRVNQFGEELEAALRLKFNGHWYPEKPFKGSAYRCVKTTPPLDPVFEIASREAGMDLMDIQENLPSELSIWIDPGEVSYRMSEKGPVKILYSDGDRLNDAGMAGGPDPRGDVVIKSFNPDAQVFKPTPVDMTSHFGGLSLNSGPATPVGYKIPATPPATSMITPPFGGTMQTVFKAPTSLPLNGFGGPKVASNNIMSAGQFAQTKFGSTKLKTNGKRNNNQQRLSPTEFGNFVKQKALLQQQIGHHQQPPMSAQQYFGGNMSPGNSRSMSPDYPLDAAQNYLFMSSRVPETPSPPAPNPSQSLMTPFGGGTLSNGGQNQSNMTSSFGVGPSILDSSLDELFGYSMPSMTAMTSSKATSYEGTRRESSPMSRFSSFLESSPFIGSSTSSGSILGSSPESAGSTSSSTGASPPIMTGPGNGEGITTLDGSSGSNNNSNFEEKSQESMSVSGVSFPNQYQHLLVAN